MPELPEVELVRRDLTDAVVSKQLDTIESLYPTTVHNFTNDSLDTIHYGRVTAVERRGKYLIFILDQGLQLLCHLRMTGKFVLAEETDQPTKHTRATLHFADGSRLFFIDARTFGHIDIYRAGSPIPALDKLGLEPFDPALTGSWLRDKLRGRHAPIKNVLLDQTVIAGVGNIYASEALYRAKINPTQAANRLSRQQLDLLVDAVGAILLQSIALGGTTIKDYRRVDEKRGEFQQYLKVYGQEIAACGHQVQKIKQAGRSTYYCAKCQ